ncbi:hydroxyethylthiazole kinase, partial [Salmonella enterica subsp. enterica serovar Anatum]|nr:hydroxyethylthiazole kinase [Salmonella enterica subsp. enterica serovar Anatum]
NASEILALSGMALGGRGVDTTEAALAALPAAQALARQIDCIVVVTGEIDYVTNGQRTLSIPGGDPLMTRIVGTGCALSAVVAASCALPGAALDNVASACCWMKLAGQVAAERSEGPGSFIPAFLDALYHLDMEAANATN